jgi:hypothetical protein
MLFGGQEGFLPCTSDHPIRFRKGEPMKPFVAFLLIMCLGLFCIVGCSQTGNPPPNTKVQQNLGTNAATPGGGDVKPGDAKPADKLPGLPSDKK